MVKKAHHAIEENKVLIEYYQDFLEYEGAELTPEQKKSYDMKIKQLEGMIEFNVSFLRYTEPLL